MALSPCEISNAGGEKLRFGVQFLGQSYAGALVDLLLCFVSRRGSRGGHRDPETWAKTSVLSPADLLTLILAGA
jgi:hypothetical protein